MAQAVQACPLCGFLSPSLTLYVSHLRLVHSQDRNFSVICGISNCTKSFRRFAAFGSHVYRHHRSDLGLEKSETLVGEHSLQNVVAEPCTAPHNESTSPAMEPEEQMEVVHTGGVPSDLQRQKDVATFLLNLSEGRQLSQRAISEVIDGCRKLCEQTVCSVKGEVALKLSECNFDPAAIECVMKAFCDISDPFHGIDTVYLREKFFAEHMNYIVSQCNK